jgi:hypothetical protein
MKSLLSFEVHMPIEARTVKKWSHGTKIDDSEERLGLVLQARNPSTWEAGAGGLGVGGQPRLHSKTLSQKKML